MSVYLQRHFSENHQVLNVMSMHYLIKLLIDQLKTLVLVVIHLPKPHQAIRGRDPNPNHLDNCPFITNDRMTRPP